MDTNGLILIPAVVYFLPSVLILILAVYLIPSIIAAVRNHREVGAVFRLNLFLGWTFIGWLAALVWAMERRNEHD